MQAFVELDGETIELDIDENGDILNSAGFVIPFGAPITIMGSMFELNDFFSGGK